MTPTYYLPKDVLDRAYRLVEEWHESHQESPSEPASIDDELESTRGALGSYSLDYAPRFASIDDALEHFAEETREREEISE